MTNVAAEEPTFRYVRMSESLGGTSTACERLPAAPAIYAWFRSVKLSGSASSDTFVESVTSFLRQRAALDHRARLGSLHWVTLEAHSALSLPKIERLARLGQNAAFRDYLARVLDRAALLQPPLYVGKAQDLQQRIKQHLDPMSDLAVRLRAATIDIRECVLAYAVLDDAPVDTDDSMLTLVEEILCHLCRPGFSARLG